MRGHASVLALLLLAAQPVLAQKAGPGEREVARDGSLIVFSDVADLTSADAAEVIGRVRAAYEFVASQQRWPKGEALSHDLGVRVVSDARMREIAPKAKGVAIGKHTVVITARFLEEERSSRTLAHEVTHIQDRRHLAAKGAKLPHWFTEGRAVAMGRAYTAKLSLRDPKYDDSIARVVSTVTVAEAKKILVDEAYLSEKKMASVFRMEALGYHFLEWIRVRQQATDFDARLARIVARVGAGAKLEDAFAAELKKGLSELEKDFFEHLERTRAR